MSNIKTSEDIMDAIETIYEGIMNGKTNVQVGRAANNAVKSMVAMTEIELKHAKLTGRLKEGSDELPIFRRVVAKTPKTAKKKAG